MPSLPLKHLQASRYLTLALLTLGHRIFLSGGAAAYRHLAGTAAARAVKDLDFRIVLPYHFRSARGQSLLIDINAVLQTIDDGCKGMRLDGATGLTIHCADFLNVEVSITVTELPVNEKIDTIVEPGYPVVYMAVGIVDGVYDKMLSLMFRTVESKSVTDLNDLLGLIAVSGRAPDAFVRDFFQRRGAAYAFSSKPSEFGRTLGKLKVAVHPRFQAEQDRTRQNMVEDTKLLAQNPEAMMLTDLYLALDEMTSADVLKPFRPAFVALKKAVKAGRDQALTAARHRPLSRHTPPGVQIKSDIAAKRPYCVVAGRTLLGSWEV